MVDIYFTPDGLGQRAGGVSRYFDALHRGLIIRGHRSRIFAGLNNNLLIREAPAVIGARSPYFRGRSQLNRELCHAWLRTRPSTAIMHNTWYSPHIPRGIRQRVAVTIHDLIFARLGHLFRDGVADATLEAQHRWCNRADIIFAVSETTRKELCRYLGVDESRVVVTPLGADHIASRPAGNGRKRKSSQLLYVGQRGGYKNWTLLARALQGLPDYTLVNVGGGRPTAAERILLERARLLDRVVFMDADDRMLRDLYDESLAVVVTALYEGFGLPALEACRRGCLVISSGTGAQREVLGDAATYFDPQEADSLVAAVGEACSREGQLRRLSETHASMYRWSRTVELSEAAYGAL
jgi:glycosyltransferase involved in cell wall biosynthesis